MVRFVIINGLGGCGKSTFIELCQEYCNNPDNLKAHNWMVSELSTVDFVKEVAMICGWKGKKDKKDREFLHDLKEAMEKWDNIPNKKVLEDAEMIIKNYLGLNHLFFVNIREPESIERFSQLIMENGYEKPFKILIESNISSNEVDSIAQQINSVKYNRTYKNNGTLKDLADTAGDFIEEIIHARQY